MLTFVSGKYVQKRLIECWCVLASQRVHCTLFRCRTADNVTWLDDETSRFQFRLSHDDGALNIVNIVCEVVLCRRGNDSSAAAIAVSGSVGPGSYLPKVSMHTAVAKLPLITFVSGGIGLETGYEGPWKWASPTPRKSVNFCVLKRWPAGFRFVKVNCFVFVERYQLGESCQHRLWNDMNCVGFGIKLSRFLLNKRACGACDWSDNPTHFPDRLW